MTRASHIPARARAGGFTLVEALMAIFILAIGLLSLAAIFPAGIELLRRGSNDLDAVNAANEIYGKLLSNSALSSDRLNEGFTSMIRENPNADAKPNGWMPELIQGIDVSLDPVQMDLADHSIEFTVLVDPSNPLLPASSSMSGPIYVTYHLGDRVWPSLRQPRFVWDVFLRRPDSAVPATDLTAPRHMAGDVQMALILRRVDPDFARLMRETEDLNPADLPRPPIRDEKKSTPGNEIYEAPRMVSGQMIAYSHIAVEGQRFRWTGGTTGPAGEMLSALRQPRQWLLDSDGNVWRIARVRDIDNRIYIEFAPEPTREQAERLAASSTFIYCETPPLLIDVRTFSSGAGY